MTMRPHARSSPPGKAVTPAKQPARPGEARAGAASPAARPGAKSAAGAKTAASGGKAPGGAKVKLARPAARVRTGTYRADIGKRIGAGAIDGVVGAVIATAIVFQLGPWLAVVPLLAYLLLRDALPVPALEFRSVGKKILGLSVEHEDTGEARLDPVTSIKRNAPLAAGLVVAPLLWGTSGALALAVAALPAGVEIAMILSDPNGLRIGDRIARTKVLD